MFVTPPLGREPGVYQTHAETSMTTKLQSLLSTRPDWEGEPAFPRGPTPALATRLTCTPGRAGARPRSAC